MSSVDKPWCPTESFSEPINGRALSLCRSAASENHACSFADLVEGLLGFGYDRHAFDELRIQEISGNQLVEGLVANLGIPLCDSLLIHPYSFFLRSPG